jgi:hypothetical protein
MNDLGIPEKKKEALMTILTLINFSEMKKIKPI